jgi:two-component system LytT family sensor kinase
MKTGWYKSRAMKVLVHVAFWAVALSLPYLLDTHHGIARHRENEARERSFFYLNFITNLLWIGPFYFNAYLLVPKLFYRRHYLSFAASLLLVFATVMLVHELLHGYLFNLGRFSFQGATGFLLPAFILTIAISTAFRVVGDRMEADRKTKQRQEENLKTELSFLRSQINPHFIFNILNNLVALEQMKSPELGPTILKLSALLQYMLYDTDEERVPLNREIEYLQSYIDLQRQRFGQKIPITVSFEEPAGSFEIEPMLLIPFVENAFKHGVGQIDRPGIEITLRVKGKMLCFAVRNRYNPASSETKDKGSGIGLGNVRRRLKLLYAAQHRLFISQNEGWFIVSLELNLH